MARIGLLLDLGNQSITVYKNDARLGVMAHDLPEPPLVWAVDISQYDQVAILRRAPAVDEIFPIARARLALPRWRLSFPRRNGMLQARKS